MYEHLCKDTVADGLDFTNIMRGYNSVLEIIVFQLSADNEVEILVSYCKQVLLAVLE